MHAVIQLGLAEEFLKSIRPTHLIFDKNWNALGTTKYLADDPDHGLAKWFFGFQEEDEGGGYSSLEHGDLLYGNVIAYGDGSLEWVPAMGPAPCWKACVDDFDDVKQMLKALREWIKENY